MTKVVQVIRYFKFCCFTFKFTQLSSNTKLIVQMTSFSFNSQIEYYFIGETHGKCVKLLLKQITCYNWTGSICLTQALQYFSCTLVAYEKSILAQSLLHLKKNVFNFRVAVISQTKVLIQ